jgi:transposase
MSRERRRFTAEQKAAVVRRHLAGKETVSDLADELRGQPSQIHLWVKQVLDLAEQAFDRPVGGRRPAPDAKDRQIAALQATVAQKDAKLVQQDAKLVQKNEVISELMQEHVQLKKVLGEP